MTYLRKLSKSKQTPPLGCAYLDFPTLNLSDLVPIDVNAEFHRLHDSHRHLLRQDVSHDVDTVCLGLQAI